MRITAIWDLVTIIQRERVSFNIINRTFIYISTHLTIVTRSDICVDLKCLHRHRLSVKESRTYKIYTRGSAKGELWNKLKRIQKIRNWITSSVRSNIKLVIKLLRKQRGSHIKKLIMTQHISRVSCPITLKQVTF